MKRMMIFFFALLLSACDAPNFVADAPKVPVTTKTPEHFVLPARFALVRTVYGKIEAAGTEEQAIWTDLASRAENLGTFTPLIAPPAYRWRSGKLFNTAREQRYNYLLLMRMNPANGSADVSLIDVGSGGVMATTQAVSPKGGQRGFWGGEISNPKRLERVTLNIAKATAPAVEDLLRGVAQRQR